MHLQRFTTDEKAAKAAALKAAAADNFKGAEYLAAATKYEITDGASLGAPRQRAHVAAPRECAYIAEGS